MRNDIQSFGINGPVVTVLGNTRDLSMHGDGATWARKRLVGEVIGITDAKRPPSRYTRTPPACSPANRCTPPAAPMCATLGPGILDNIFDGIERPAESHRGSRPAPLSTGAATCPLLDTERLWDVTLTGQGGRHALQGGAGLRHLPRNPPSSPHKCMVPPGVFGQGHRRDAQRGTTRSTTQSSTLRDDRRPWMHELTLCQQLADPHPPPGAPDGCPPTVPLITGQRVIDTLFPIAKGGTAAIPGGFGTGKTMTQHQLAKWCDADIIVYVGCGERGNEMTQVLEEFGELIDPQIRPSADRPHRAHRQHLQHAGGGPRGFHLHRHHPGGVLPRHGLPRGHHGRFHLPLGGGAARNLRPAGGNARGGRLPGLSALPSVRVLRARRLWWKPCAAARARVTIIGAVSPQGADFSEPVTQNTKRFTRCFWALDKSLAYARHYPAINWIDQLQRVSDTTWIRWYEENVDPDFIAYRTQINALLQEENQLMEIVKLIGADVLPDDQKLVIEIARVIRVGFLQQNAYPCGRYLCPAGKAAADDAGDPATFTTRRRRRWSRHARAHLPHHARPGCSTSWSR